MVTTPAPVPSLNMIPQVVDATSGELIKRGRIKDPASLVSVDQVLWNADWESMRARALVQAMVDGQPPYNESRERVRGTAGRSNVNWGLAAQKLSDAQTPYNDILDGIDNFGTVPTNYGDQAEQDRCTAIISEEISRMLRSWDDFYKLWQQNALLFVNEGLAFAFFEDDIDWRWQIVGQQNIKFPRRIRANINEVDIFTCRRDLLPHRLYRKIENAEVAEEVGWNVAAVKEALKTAAPKGLATDDPQEWERAWKDNDITFGTTAATVAVVYGWVRELDGTISQYIARADGQGEWLYKSEGKYRSMKRLLIDYPYGVGANGDFQSIRGLGQHLFNSAGAINRVLNKTLDMTVHQMTPHLTADNEDVIQENSIRPMGPYMIVDSGLSFTEQKIPNFDQTGLAALTELRGIFDMRGRQYSANNPDNSRTQKTKYQMQLESEQSGKLSTSGLNLFMRSWSDHFKEFVRRVANPSYTQNDPGGQEVWEFRRRCLARGVPGEAIDKIDVERIEVNMGFGKGSASERRAVVGFMLESLYYRADQYAQQKINNWAVAAYTDARIANELFPVTPGLRPPVDLQFATMENVQMTLTGKAATIIPNQDHIVHVNTHLQLLFELNEGLTNMAITLEEAIPQMFPVWTHAGEHMQFVDPMNPASKEFKEALQQLGEVVTNGQKHLDAEAQRAQKEAGGAEGESGYGGTPASTYKQAVQADAELRSLDLDMQKKQMEMETDAIKRQQELIHRDAVFAQDIRQRRIKGLQDVEIASMKSAATPRKSANGSSKN